MNARSLTLSLFASLAVVAAVPACSGGGSAPKIKSFEASQTSLPMGGGEVTLTWNVSGEDELELQPFPGAVTGSAITLTVAEPTTFTLTAKKNGRSDRARVTIAVGEPFDVSGRVLSDTGAPVRNAIVVIADLTPTLTQADGTFRLENVVAPYDLVVTDPTVSDEIWMIRGLTRPDPTVRIRPDPEWSGDLDITLTGGLAAPTPTPPPEHRSVYALRSPEGVAYDADGGFGDAAAFVNVEWYGPPTTILNGTAIQYSTDSVGLPVDFVGFDRVTGVTLSNGQVGDLAFDRAPVDARTIAGTVTAEGEQPINVYVAASIDFPPEQVPMSGAPNFTVMERLFFPSSPVGTSGAFTRSVPDVAGARHAIRAEGFYPSGSFGVMREGLMGGETDIDIELREPPRLLLPITEAVVDDTTMFVVSGDPELINRCTFVLFTTTQDYFVTVVDARDSMPLPDLTPTGIAPSSVYGGTWSCAFVGPFQTVDEASGPTSLDAGDVSLSAQRYDNWSFSVVPEE